MNRKQKKGRQGVKNEEITGKINKARRCNDKTEEKERGKTTENKETIRNERKTKITN